MLAEVPSPSSDLVADIAARCVDLAQWVWPYIVIVLRWLADKVLGPAIVAVIFSVHLARQNEKRKNQRDQQISLAIALRNDIDALQKLSRDYWSKGGQDSVLETHIMSLVADISEAFVVLNQHYSIDIDANTKIANILDVVSGGDFQGKRRKSDVMRVSESARHLRDLKYELIRKALL